MSIPTPNSNPNKVFVTAVFFMAGFKCMGRWLFRNTTIAVAGFLRLKNMINAHGVRCPKRTIATTQPYAMMKNSIRMVIALERPTRIASVFRPPSLSPSKSRILFASIIPATSNILGMDKSTASVVIVPV